MCTDDNKVAVNVSKTGFFRCCYLILLSFTWRVIFCSVYLNCYYVHCTHMKYTLVYCIKSYGWMNIVQLFQRAFISGIRLRIISLVLHLETEKFFCFTYEIMTKWKQLVLFTTINKIWYMITLTPNLRKVNQINAVADYFISCLMIQFLLAYNTLLNARSINYYNIKQFDA